ncbi:hypothetical protein PSEUDO8O_20128 [Pseudomonas sp. 8O]|nr:hypothetical protein PSEUDO8O_20128 [Pseudomonas sp. 8O]
MFGSGKKCIPPLSGSRHEALLVGESAAREAFCLSLITGCADALWFGRPGGLAIPGVGKPFYVPDVSLLRVVWRGTVPVLR